MDWPAFLDQYGIEFVTRGYGIAGSHIAIQCPYCGSQGRAFHLHINLDGKGFHCWRQPDKKGGDAVLVQKLLSCTWAYANEIAGKRFFPVSDLDQQVRKMFKRPAPIPQKHLKIVKELRPLAHRASCLPYIKYLKGRGYDQIDMLYDQIGLRYCTQGPFHHRIIFPIHMDGKLVSWTGRAINGSMEPRYKTLTADVEKAALAGLPSAVAPINNFLLWYDHLVETDADTLFLVEGPFDALRIRWIGENFGITATCFFTSIPSDIQIDLLHTIVPKFKNRYTLLDRLAEAKALATASKLTSLGVTHKFLPSHRKDPGVIILSELLRLASTNIRT